MTLDMDRALEIDGWMDRNELAWLYDTAKTMKGIVEIGAWCGRSTFALCSGCLGMVYTIDHFMGNPEHGKRAKEENVIGKFRGNTQHFSNLLTVIGESTIVAKYMQFNCDMLFIDGAHEYEAVVADIEAWRWRVGTLIAGHDWGEKGVARAARHALPGKEIKHGPGSIWYAEVGK